MDRFPLGKSHANSRFWILYFIVWNGGLLEEILGHSLPYSHTDTHTQTHTHRHTHTDTHTHTHTHTHTRTHTKTLRRLWHYQRVQSQGHHTINCPGERGAQRGIARQSSLKEQERAIVSQTSKDGKELSSVRLARTRKGHSQSDQRGRERAIVRQISEDEKEPSSVRSARTRKGHRQSDQHWS